MTPQPPPKAMQVTGRCRCGSITFQAEADPDNSRSCRCTDCQHLSGAAFRVVLPVDETEFELLSGTPKIYIKTPESSERRQQVFCQVCGTPIYATSHTPGPRRLGLRVGALDQRRDLTPKRQIWTSS